MTFVSLAITIPNDAKTIANDAKTIANVAETIASVAMMILGRATASITNLTRDFNSHFVCTFFSGFCRLKKSGFERIYLRNCRRRIINNPNGNKIETVAKSSLNSGIAVFNKLPVPWPKIKSSVIKMPVTKQAKPQRTLRCITDKNLSSIK